MRNVGLFERIGERLQGRAGYNDVHELINKLGQVCSDIATAEATGNGEASRHVSGLYSRAFPDPPGTSCCWVPADA